MLCFRIDLVLILMSLVRTRLKGLNASVEAMHMWVCHEINPI